VRDDRSNNHWVLVWIRPATRALFPLRRRYQGYPALRRRCSLPALPDEIFAHSPFPRTQTSLQLAELQPTSTFLSSLFTSSLSTTPSHTRFVRRGDCIALSQQPFGVSGLLPQRRQSACLPSSLHWPLPRTLARSHSNNRATAPPYDTRRSFSNTTPPHLTSRQRKPPSDADCCCRGCLGDEAPPPIHRRSLPTPGQQFQRPLAQPPLHHANLARLPTTPHGRTSPHGSLSNCMYSFCGSAVSDRSQCRKAFGGSPRHITALTCILAQ
jgi:hypothetical protein